MRTGYGSSLFQPRSFRPQGMFNLSSMFQPFSTHAMRERGLGYMNNAAMQPRGLGAYMPLMMSRGLFGDTQRPEHVPTGFGGMGGMGGMFGGGQQSNPIALLQQLLQQLQRPQQQTPQQMQPNLHPGMMSQQGNSAGPTRFPAFPIPELQGTAPPNTNYEADVKQLYLQQLGREADPAGLNYYVNRLRSGQTVQDIVKSMQASSENQGRSLGGTPMLTIPRPQTHTAPNFVQQQRTNEATNAAAQGGSQVATPAERAWLKEQYGYEPHIVGPGHYILEDGRPIWDTSYIANANPTGNNPANFANTAFPNPMNAMVPGSPQARAAQGTPTPTPQAAPRPTVTAPSIFPPAPAPVAAQPAPVAAAPRAPMMSPIQPPVPQPAAAQPSAAPQNPVGNAAFANQMKIMGMTPNATQVLNNPTPAWEQHFPGITAQVSPPPAPVAPPPAPVAAPSGPAGTNYAADVQQLYQQQLGRAADPGGLQYYVNALNNGASVQDIVRSMQASPEAQARKR